MLWPFFVVGVNAYSSYIPHASLVGSADTGAAFPTLPAGPRNVDVFSQLVLFSLIG